VQAKLAAIATVRDYHRGDFLWHEGDESDSLTLIVKGRVKIVREAAQGT
jgi:CRP-like cAMP-binding protein